MTAAHVKLVNETVAALSAVPGGGVNLSSGGLGDEEACAEIIARLLRDVRDKTIILREVDAAMAQVDADRVDWIRSHPDSFEGGENGAVGKAFRKNWCANYEISNILKEHPPVCTPAGGTGAARQVGFDFCRYNQFPLLSEAAPDERVRIESDEAKFGGVIAVQADGSELPVTYGASDSVFFVERFGTSAELPPSPTSVLESPAEYAATAAAAGAAGVDVGDGSLVSNVRAVAFDLQGHFSAGFTCTTKAWGNTLVFINTTGGSYVDRPAICWYYDLLFPPKDGDAPMLEPAASSGGGGGGVAPAWHANVKGGCLGGCGFFGNEAFGGYCSKCAKHKSKNAKP